MSLSAEFSGPPSSPTSSLQELYEFRARMENEQRDLDNKQRELDERRGVLEQDIRKKQKTQNKDSYQCSHAYEIAFYNNQYGQKFVKEIGFENLGKLSKVESIDAFIKNADLKMASGIDGEGSPFLAFRIELMDLGSHPICTVITKVFQTLYNAEESTYVSSKYVEGDDKQQYQSPILNEKGEVDTRKIRGLIKGEKFDWDAVPLKKTSEGEYKQIEGTKISFFRLKGGFDRGSALNFGNYVF